MEHGTIGALVRSAADTNPPASLALCSNTTQIDSSHVCAGQHQNSAIRVPTICGSQAYDALRQACYGAQRDRLLLLQHETLTTEPAKAMQAIYTFIAEPAFEHDFSHVDYDVTEFDERAGTPGLHTVRGTVKAEPRETLLPPDLFNRFIRDAFWRDPERIPAGLQVV